VGPLDIWINFNMNVVAADGEWELGDEVIVLGPGYASNLNVTGTALTFMVDTPDASCYRFVLSGIASAADPLAIMPDRTLPLAVLFGDGSGNYMVDLPDANPPPSPIEPPNFRYDYNVNGDFDALDAIWVHNHLGHSVSCPTE
jgi:hypothetical protein